MNLDEFRLWMSTGIKPREKTFFNDDGSIRPDDSGFFNGLIGVFGVVVVLVVIAVFFLVLFALVGATQ
jgi:hypothetical protein